MTYWVYLCSFSHTFKIFVAKKFFQTQIHTINVFQNKHFKKEMENREEVNSIFQFCSPQQCGLTTDS